MEGEKQVLITPYRLVTTMIAALDKLTQHYPGDDQAGQRQLISDAQIPLKKLRNIVKNE